MAFICILCGGLQVLLLLSLTGVLASLAALSRLMELTFAVVQPAVIFTLRQSFWMILSLRRMSRVLGEICFMQPTDSGLTIDLTIPETRIAIGTTPVRVPYFRRNYEVEQLADVEKKTSSPIVPERENDDEENVRSGSVQSAKRTRATFDLASEASAKFGPTSQQSAEQFHKSAGMNIAEDATNSTSYTDPPKLESVKTRESVKEEV